MRQQKLLHIHPADNSAAAVGLSQSTPHSILEHKAGEMRIESIRFEDGEWSKRLEVKFDTQQAREAVKTLDLQKASMDEIDHVDHARVLMTFERSSKSNSDLHQPTGERVVIDAVSNTPKALIYASENAEQQIKHEIRDADDNIYKKGFIVDANATSRSGRVVGYSITNVHQVIDLRDD